MFSRLATGPKAKVQATREALGTADAKLTQRAMCKQKPNSKGELCSHARNSMLPSFSKDF